MTIQAVSFKANDDQTVQKKNYLPAAIGAAVVTTAGGGAAGHFLTKLNEDSFVKAAIEDQKKSALADMKEAVSARNAKLKPLEGEAKTTYENELKEFQTEMKKRKSLNVAENTLAKAQKEAADANKALEALYEGEGDAKKLKDGSEAGKAAETAAKEKVKTAGEAVEAANNKVGEAKTAYEAAEGSKKLTAEQVKEKHNALVEKRKATRPAAGADLDEVIKQEKIFAKDGELSKKIKDVNAYDKLDDAKKAESDLVKNLKERFNAKERTEETKKLVEKLEKAAKRSKMWLYGGIGLGVGVLAILGAALAGKNKAE